MIRDEEDPRKPLVLEQGPEPTGAVGELSTLEWPARPDLAGPPDDIAAAVAVPVGPDAVWVTGQNARANGGLI